MKELNNRNVLLKTVIDVDKSNIIFSIVYGVIKQENLNQAQQVIASYNSLKTDEGYSFVVVKEKNAYDIEEMKGNIIEVNYAETNNLSKGFFVKKTFIAAFEPLNKGGGSASGQNSGNPNPDNSIQKKNVEKLPENVRDSYKKYEESGWKGARKDQNPKTKGGGEFKNVPPKLPKTDSNGKKIEYREYDVNSKIPGQPRDRERFVRGSDGRTYYSNGHYETFTEII